MSSHLDRTSLVNKVSVFKFSRLLKFHLDKEITENIFTVTENILQKKTFVHLLGLPRNVIAGTKRVTLSKRYGSIVPARVANYSARFGLSYPLTEISM